MRIPPNLCHGSTPQSEVRQVEVIYGYWGICRAANIRYETMVYSWGGRSGFCFE